MNTVLKVSLIAMLFSATFLSSCDGIFRDCIEGNDRIALEERPVGSFSSVASYGSYVVDIAFGTEERLSVEADENLLPYIDTYIRGNTLVIENRDDRCLRSLEPIQIHVTAKEIDRLKLAGSGIINCNNITGDDVEIELPGSGNIECHSMHVDFLRSSLSGSGVIELWGRAKTTDHKLSGSGSIKTINLEQDVCYADIPGSGVISAWVNDKLDVNISGSGSLYYKGDPVVTTNISGSGSVRRY